MQTSREIINAIIRDKQCPERMGLHEHYWAETIGEWHKQGLPAYVKDGADAPWYFNYDLNWVDGTWFDSSPIRGQNIVLEENDDTVISINGWGNKSRNWKKRSGTPEHLGFDCTSAEIWRAKYREPLLSLDPARFGDLQKLKNDYKRKMSTDRWIYYSNVLVSEILRGALGDVVMLESMYMDPDWIKDFNDVLTNHLIMHYDWLFREVGKPDGMFIYEDMGYTGAPFFSPELQRELIFPYHKRFIGFCHDNGLPLVMHSCGKIRPFLQSIFDAGVDCLQVLEAKAGQHVAEFAEAAGNKLAYMGNLNIRAYETNDRAKLEAEILPKLDTVRKNRIPYVFHSDHSIPASVSLATYEYSLHLFKRYGYY